MAVEKFRKMVCGGTVEMDISSPGWITFVKHRIFGVPKGVKGFDCKHLSVFGGGEPRYVEFLCKDGDAAANYVADHGFSKLKGKVHFHDIEEGVEDEDYFMQMLGRLLNEIDALMASKNLSVGEKRTKIKKLVAHKFKGYQDVVKK